MTVSRPKQLLGHPSRQRLRFFRTPANWDMSQQEWLWNRFFSNCSGLTLSVSFQKHFIISLILIVGLSEGQAGEYWVTKQNNVPFRIKEIWTEKYVRNFQKTATNFDAPNTSLILDPKIIFRSLWLYVTNIGTEWSFVVKTGGHTEATYLLWMTSKKHNGRQYMFTVRSSLHVRGQV
jgi:hypothetical protein